MQIERIRKESYSLSVSIFHLVLVSAVISLLAVAQAAEREEEVYPKEEIKSFVRYTARRSTKADAGRVEIIQSEIEYSRGLKFFRQLPVKVALNQEYIGIKNETQVELPSRLIGLSSDIETTLPFFGLDRAYLRLGVSPSFFGDDWEFHSSGFRIPSRYYFIFRKDEKWTFVGGVALYPDFQRKVFPIAGFIYKPNDKLSFNIIPERPNINYAINDKTSLFAEGGVFIKEFEVTRDNQENVVLRYAGFNLGSGVSHKINKSAQTFFSVAGVFNRSLRYRDSVGKVSMKNSLYGELRMEVKFAQ